MRSLKAALIEEELIPKTKSWLAPPVFPDGEEKTHRGFRTGKTLGFSRKTRNRRYCHAGGKKFYGI